jgi:hypothetical protein
MELLTTYVLKTLGGLTKNRIQWSPPPTNSTELVPGAALNAQQEKTRARLPFAPVCPFWIGRLYLNVALLYILTYRYGDLVCLVHVTNWLVMMAVFERLNGMTTTRRPLLLPSPMSFESSQQLKNKIRHCGVVHLGGSMMDYGWWKVLSIRHVSEWITCRFIITTY